MYNLVPTAAHRASECPLLQRWLLAVWAARTGDGDLSCADWASEKQLTASITPQLTVLPATETEHHLSPHPCQWSSECAATGNCKITLPKMDSAYSAVWRRKKNPPAQLLALALLTYCCTQGIYIYSTTRNRCWVIEKLEPSIVLLTCHHREICFNLLKK